MASETEEGRFLNCSPEQLGRHAAFFRRRGWHGFLPRDVLGGLRPGVCFTFDDAYVSAVSHAPSVLEAHGFLGAFYVVPSLVGESSSWDGDKARPLSDWSSLLAVAANGHEMGNHTLSHPRLSELTIEEQTRQIVEASSLLREKGFEPQSIAFPYGSYDSNTMAAMASAGIGVGLALGKRPVGSEAINCLPRIVVGYSDSVAKLLYKIYIRPKLP